MKTLNLAFMAMFYIFMLAFVGRAVFGKVTVDEDSNLMIWAIWCLMMCYSRRAAV